MQQPEKPLTTKGREEEEEEEEGEGEEEGEEEGEGQGEERERKRQADLVMPLPWVVRLRRARSAASLRLSALMEQHSGHSHFLSWFSSTISYTTQADWSP